MKHKITIGTMPLIASSKLQKHYPTHYCSGDAVLSGLKSKGIKKEKVLVKNPIGLSSQKAKKVSLNSQEKTVDSLPSGN